MIFEIDLFSFQELLTIYYDVESSLGSGRDTRERIVETTKSPHKSDHSPARKGRTLAKTVPSFVSNISDNKITNDKWRPTEAEFDKISGERGKIDFMNLQVYLVMNDRDVPDKEIRQWIAIHDEKGKGYLNLQDFLRAKTLPGVESMLVPDTAVEGNSGSNNNKRVMSRTSGGRLQERDKLRVLKQAFDLYDYDGDGFISRVDLKNTFEAQGKPKSDQEISEWMSRSDSHRMRSQC